MTRGLTTWMVLVANAALAQTLVPFSDQTAGVAGRVLGDPAIVTTPGAEAVVGTDTMVGGAWAWYLPLDGGVPAQTLNLGAAGPPRGADFRRFAALGDYTVVPAAVSGRILAFHPDAGADGGPLLYDTSDPGFVFSVPTSVALADKVQVDAANQPTMFITDNGLRIQVFSLQVDAQGRFGGVVGPTINLMYTAEGLVSDDRKAVLYAAAPTGGLFAIDENTYAVSPLDTNTTSGGNLQGQPAGLAFYPLSDGGGLLLAAVPARDSVAVYAVTSNTTASFVGRFGVGFPGATSPVVRSSHFIDVTPYPMPGFPRGLLVIADPLAANGANYKLVGWQDVASLVGLPVEVASFDGGAPPSDAGVQDGGVDGGTTDGGLSDGGAGGGGGGSHLGPGTPGEDPVPPKCGCAGGSATILFPGVLLLLALFPRRRRTT